MSSTFHLVVIIAFLSYTFGFMLGHSSGSKR